MIIKSFHISLYRLRLKKKASILAITTALLMMWLFFIPRLSSAGQQQNFSPEFHKFIQEVQHTYIIPAGIDIQYLEMKRPLLLAVILGDALGQQEQYLDQDPYYNRDFFGKLVGLYKEVAIYLGYVAKITPARAPDGSRIRKEDLCDIAAKSMDGGYGDSVWRDLGISRQTMDSGFVFKDDSWEPLPFGDTPNAMIDALEEKPKPPVSSGGGLLGVQIKELDNEGFDNHHEWKNKELYFRKDKKGRVLGKFRYKNFE